MKFYSAVMQPVIGPVYMMPQKGSIVGASKRPMNSYAILRDHGSLLFDAPFSWTLDTVEELIGLECAPLALILSHRDLLESGDAFAEIAEHHGLRVLLHPADRNVAIPCGITPALYDPTSGPSAGILREADIELIPIPGHSPGSIMLYIAEEGGILLAGDSAVGPGPEQEGQKPRLQRPVGADDDPRFLSTWRAVVETRPLAAILPLHGAWYRRRDLGDAAFDAVVANIWDGPPMDPRRA